MYAIGLMSMSSSVQNAARLYCWSAKQTNKGDRRQSTHPNPARERAAHTPLRPALGGAGVWSGPDPLLCRVHRSLPARPRTIGLRRPPATLRVRCAIRGVAFGTCVRMPVQARRMARFPDTHPNPTLHSSSIGRLDPRVVKGSGRPVQVVCPRGHPRGPCGSSCRVVTHCVRPSPVYPRERRSLASALGGTPGPPMQ